MFLYGVEMLICLCTEGKCTLVFSRSGNVNLPLYKREVYLCLCTEEKCTLVFAQRRNVPLSLHGVEMYSPCTDGEYILVFVPEKYSLIFVKRNLHLSLHVHKGSVHFKPRKSVHLP